jgi:hypothetical protein
MKTLYADFNNFDANGGLPLTCVGSIQSIRALREPLSEGEQVVLSDGDVMVTAEVHLRPNGTWIARCVSSFADADQATRDSLQISA